MSDVVVFDSQLIGKGGGNVFFSRNGVSGSSSCSNCGPGGTPYSASLYLVSGTQTVTVERTKRTLLLVASPDTSYDGDAVTFEVSSSDGRSVSVREWIWVSDSATVYTSPPCGVPSVTCTWVPPGRGTMFVRARIGTNAFIEQASAEAEILPVGISARVLYSSIPANDTATIVVKVTPQRTIYHLAVDGDSSVCSAATLQCRVRVLAPRTFQITGMINGHLLSCTADVDTLPCKTGIPDVDNVTVRTAIDSVWKLGGDSGPANDRLERVAFVVDSAGSLITRYAPPAANATPCSTPNDYNWLFQNGWVDSSMKVVSTMHTHPINWRDPLPAACGSGYGGRDAGRGPSYSDYDAVNKTKVHPVISLRLSPNWRHIVVERSKVWSMDTIPMRWVQTRKVLPNGTKQRDSVFVPKKIHQNSKTYGYDRKSPAGSLCLKRSNTIPHYTGGIPQ